MTELSHDVNNKNVIVLSVDMVCVDPLMLAVAKSSPKVLMRTCRQKRCLRNISKKTRKYIKLPATLLQIVCKIIPSLIVLV